MFTSIKPSKLLDCGHYLHTHCLIAYSKTNYRCPMCSKSMVNMKSSWNALDLEISLTIMPEEYRNTWFQINCHDCNTKSDTLFHILGLKCLKCGSYNTQKLGNGVQPPDYVPPPPPIMHEDLTDDEHYNDEEDSDTDMNHSDSSSDGDM